MYKAKSEMTKFWVVIQGYAEFYKVFFPNFEYLLNPSYSCHGFVSQVLNNKQLVDEVFGISGIIKVEVSMITLTEAEGWVW